jgi:hypothetical protein
MVQWRVMQRDNAPLTKSNSNGAVIPNPRVSPCRPNGVSISSHFANWDKEAWYSPILQKALDIVDRVHGTDIWQKVRVVQDFDDLNQPWSAGFKGTPKRAFLFLNEDQSAGVFEILHELGHGILAYGFDDFDNHKIVDDSFFQAWRAAIRQSRGYTQLAQMQKQTTVQIYRLSGAKEYFVDQELLEYYLSWHELFARSYAQYVSLVSGELELLEAVAQASHSPLRQLLYATQWQDDDFDEIFNALENMFLNKGWLK